MREVATGPGCHGIREWRLDGHGEGGEVDEVSAVARYSCEKA